MSVKNISSTGGGETPKKPKLFVGSSAEYLDVARAIHANLADVAEVTLWTHSVFGLNNSGLESLLKALGCFDFAVFALTPDDIVTSRGSSQAAPRDNVLFELGLFLGRLGKERCFAIAPDSNSMKVLSDLHGVTIARYETGRADENWMAALGPSCTLIREAIGAAWPPSTSESVALVAGGTGQVRDAQADGSSILDALGVESNPAIELSPLRESFDSWFHDNRFAQAFPGIRGITEITDPVAAIERLKILLRNPLTWFWKTDGGTAAADPIWWWRGTCNMPIHHFSLISETEVLVNCEEFPIKKVIASNDGAYWQSFVYLELHPKPPTGLYKPDPAFDANRVERWGYVHEEYGLFDGQKVSRSEYDDGIGGH